MEFKQNDFLAIDIMQGNKKLGTEYYVFYRYRTDKENFDALVVIPFSANKDEENEVVFGRTNIELNEGLRYATEEERFMMTNEIIKQYNYIKMLNNYADFIRENVI